MYCVDIPVITKDHLGVSIKSNRLLKECNDNCHFNCVRILELDTGPARAFLHRGVILEYQSKSTWSYVAQDFFLPPKHTFACQSARKLMQPRLQPSNDLPTNSFTTAQSRYGHPIKA